MSRSWLRIAELVALVVIAGGLIGLAFYMIAHGKVGEAFGTLIGAISLTVSAVGRVGQAQAMNAMAEYLAKSTPVKEDRDVP